MSDQSTLALIYLDTGEIFEADGDGFPTEVHVATMEAGVLDDDVHALGQIFAAAPELLEALIDTRDELEKLLRDSGLVPAHSSALALADATIAKARGAL